MEWIRKGWMWFLAAIAFVAGFVISDKKYVPKLDATAKTEQNKRKLSAEEDARLKKDIDGRFDNAKKLRKNFPKIMILIALLVSLAVPVRAGTVDRLEQALVVIDQLTVQLDEMIEICEAYKGLLEREIVRREEAESALSASLQREEALWKAYMNVTQRRFGITMGGGVSTEVFDPMKPSIFVYAGVRY